MLKLERVYPKDFRVIRTLIKKYHSNPVHLWTVEDDMYRPNLKQFYIVDENGNQVGITSFQIFSNSLGILQKHIIFPDFRRMGYGKAAIDLIEEAAKSMEIAKLAAYVLDYSYSMQDILKEKGYVEEGYLRNHFGKNLSCYIFGKELK